VYDKDGMMNLHPRSLLLFNWLFGRKYGYSLSDLFHVLLDPPSSKSSIKAIKRIKKIIETGEYYAVYLKGFSDPIYYPKALGLDMFYQTIYELLFPYNAHYYEAANTNVAADDIVVDCGAAEGLFSFLVAKRCSKVFIVEPLPHFIKALKMTFQKFPNCEIIPVALGQKEDYGILKGEGSGTFLRTEGEGVRVKVSTIDILFKDIPVSYIKADLEGSELEMLQGAENTIKKYCPKLAITVYHSREDFDEISKYIKSINPNYNIKMRGWNFEAQRSIMLHASIK